MSHWLRGLGDRANAFLRDRSLAEEKRRFEREHAGRAPPLDGYPPDAPPERGPALAWTAGQAQRNLEHRMAGRDARLVALGKWLAPQGIEIAPALDGGELAPLFVSLHRWCFATWPALRGFRGPTISEWLASGRDGPDRVYAMLQDLGTLLGECVVRRNTSIRWGVDRDPDNLADGMASCNRVVLLADRGAGHEPFVFDIDAMVFQRYSQIHSPAERLIDPWAICVKDLLDGRYQVI